MPLHPAVSGQGEAAPNGVSAARPAQQADGQRCQAEHSDRTRFRDGHWVEQAKQTPGRSVVDVYPDVVFIECDTVVTKPALRQAGIKSSGITRCPSPFIPPVRPQILLIQDAFGRQLRWIIIEKIRAPAVSAASP